MTPLLKIKAAHIQYYLFTVVPRKVQSTVSQSHTKNKICNYDPHCKSYKEILTLDTSPSFDIKAMTLARLYSKIYHNGIKDDFIWFERSQ